MMQYVKKALSDVANNDAFPELTLRAVSKVTDRSRPVVTLLSSLPELSSSAMVVPGIWIIAWLAALLQPQLLKGPGVRAQSGLSLVESTRQKN